MTVMCVCVRADLMRTSIDPGTLNRFIDQSIEFSQIDRVSIDRFVQDQRSRGVQRQRRHGGSLLLRTLVNESTEGSVEAHMRAVAATDPQAREERLRSGTSLIERTHTHTQASNPPSITGPKSSNSKAHCAQVQRLHTFVVLFLLKFVPITHVHTFVSSKGLS